MRWLLLAALVGCGGDGKSPPPEAGFDSLAACAPSGGCMAGPKCGNACCSAGERCDNGVCMCGQNAACSQGNMCAAPGPVGGDSCGSICCGVSGPCPQ